MDPNNIPFEHIKFWTTTALTIWGIVQGVVIFAIGIGLKFVANMKTELMNEIKSNRCELKAAVETINKDMKCKLDEKDCALFRKECRDLFCEKICKQFDEYKQMRTKRDEHIDREIEKVYIALHQHSHDSHGKVIRE